MLKSKKIVSDVINDRRRGSGVRPAVPGSRTCTASGSESNCVSADATLGRSAATPPASVHRIIIKSRIAGLLAIN